MEQSYDETPAASSPPKKKRGRPRKAERMLLLPGEVSELAGVRQKRKKAFTTPVSVSGRRKRQQQGSSSARVPQSDGGAGASPDKEDTAPTVKVGQSVHGVVDGSFDAGYLVTVRVGDSDTVFRGVVFGPGMSLPLNRDNDVAPKMKKTSRDEAAEAMANSGAAAGQNDGTPLTSSAPAPASAPASVSASVPISASFAAANEVHRASAIAGLGLGFRTPTPPAAPPSGSGYGSVAFRSPSFGQSPLPNSPGGFFYPPTHTPSPNSGINSHGFYPPRGFPYPFHFPRSDFGGSPQFPVAGGPSPSPSPGPQGGLPPRPS